MDAQEGSEEEGEMMFPRCFICGEEKMFIAVKHNENYKPMWAVGCNGCGAEILESTLPKAIEFWATFCYIECKKMLESEGAKL